jgi:hypothetical protein
LDVIGAFIADTTCRELVHELGRMSPTKASELLDITTNFATGEEAVQAIFPDAKEKRKEDATEVSASRDPKKKKKKGRPGKQQRHKDALVTAAGHKNPRGPPPRGLGVFDEMLKKPCPYHRGMTKHTLEECTMMRRYFSRCRQPKDDAKKKVVDAQGGDDKDDGFPEVKSCFMIFGGRSA